MAQSERLKADRPDHPQLHKQYLEADAFVRTLVIISTKSPANDLK
jgi:hypothetical protein